MVAVFFTFALSGPLPPKEMGVILGIAVLLDAALVRLLLVPVILRLLGSWAWWLPRRCGGSCRTCASGTRDHAYERVTVGGTDTGPAPHELLPVTLASCISTMIALYAQRKQWDIGEIRVDVVYDYEREPRTFTSRSTCPLDSPTTRSPA